MNTQESKPQPDVAVKGRPADEKAKPVATATTEASAEVTADPKPRPVNPLSINRKQIKEYRNPGTWVCVPYGTVVEDLLEPAFWAHVARDLRPNTTIEVHWDDSSQYAQLYVTACQRNWAAVSLLQHWNLTKPRLPHASKQYVVKWAGPVDKFQVIRLSDNAPISSQHESEHAAHQYLREYLLKIAA